MKSTYLILGLSAVFSSTAFAADMPAPQPAAPVPVFTWTGLYLGANVGAWFAPTNPSYEAIGFPSAGFGLVPNGGGQNEGATGGFQAGYNYQIGSFLGRSNVGRCLAEPRGVTRRCYPRLSSHLDGIPWAAERRSVAQVHVVEILDGGLLKQRRRNDVDTLRYFGLPMP
jgi:hypothetical protein